MRNILFASEAATCSKTLKVLFLRRKIEGLNTEMVDDMMQSKNRLPHTSL